VREKYCWLVAGDWFVLRAKYCWLVADKSNEQGAKLRIVHDAMSRPYKLHVVLHDVVPHTHTTTTVYRRCIFYLL
jgi:hypothetical protein